MEKQKLRNIPRKPHNHIKEHQFLISTWQKMFLALRKRKSQLLYAEYLTLASKKKKKIASTTSKRMRHVDGSLRTDTAVTPSSSVQKKKQVSSD